MPAPRPCSTPAQAGVDRAGIAGDEARPCRSADAADRARDEGVRRRLRRARPHRRDHRPRQLYRIARRPFRRARHCAGRRQARGRRDDADRLCRAHRQRERRPHPIISAIDARHDHVYFQVVGGDGGSLVKPKVAPIAEALDAARFGAPHLVGNAAQDSRRPLAGRCAAAVQGRSAARARHRLGGVAGRRRRSRELRRPGRIICARPTPSRQRIRCRAAQPPAS